MCTLAWGRQEDQLWVCFNRDEQRSRLVANPPELRMVNGNPCVFARDPQGGGTWFAASGNGFALALLNSYSAGTDATSETSSSRGRIILELSGAGNLDEAAARLVSMELEKYGPFFLFLLSREVVRSWSWNNRQLEAFPPNDPYWTSSSYKPREVEHHRRQLLETILADCKSSGSVAERMRRFDPDYPKHGITMDRDSTRTVSQIELTLGKMGIRFLYYSREVDGPGYKQPKEVKWIDSTTD